MNNSLRRSTLPAIPGTLPPNYGPDPIASLDYRVTMGQRHAHGHYTSVRQLHWDCYVPEVDGVPQQRNPAWLVARFRGGAPVNRPIDLHDIGAQHRSLIVMLRAHSPGSAEKATLVCVTRGGAPDNTVLLPYQPSGPDDAHPDFAGFYRIDPSWPHRGMNGIEFVNRYELTFSDPRTILEVFYLEHPPGLTAQLEDGGPPPIPPDTQSASN